MAEDRDLHREDRTIEPTRRADAPARPDPLYDDPSSHPLGTGAGVAAGAVAGAAAGVIGGPVGMAVGAVVGGAIGGVAGNAAGEAVNPTEEEAWWRENYRSEPYYTAGRGYEDYGPAYRYGREARGRYEDWAVAEPYLAAEWANQRGGSSLSWTEARPAARAAWDRVDPLHRGAAAGPPDGNLHHYGTGMASTDSSYHTGPQGVPDTHAHAPQSLHPDDTTHMQSREMGTTNLGSGSVGWGSMADTSTMTGGTLGATTGMDAGYMAGTATGHDMATAQPAPYDDEDALDSQALEHVIETLQQLVDTSRDGQYGFERCAERAQREDLREVFRQRAEDCRVGASQLQAQIRRLGGVVTGTGSTVAGDVHRGWISAHDAVSGLDDKTLLEQAERGEDMALAHYRRALESHLPPDIRQLVEHQLEGAQRNHDQVKMLRDQARAAG